VGQGGQVMENAEWIVAFGSIAAFLNAFTVGKGSTKLLLSSLLIWVPASLDQASLLLQAPTSLLTAGDRSWAPELSNTVLLFC
jgi:hypothetical protein